MKSSSCLPFLILAQTGARVYLVKAFASSSSAANLIKKKSIPVSKTSLDLSPALLVRGGADVALKNFYSDALGFFGGIRIPATFLAGSSLAAIFTLKSAAASLSNDDNLSTLERRVIKFYHLVSLLAFLLSLNTIVLATSAHTSILHGRFDQMAETAYLLMRREFEYEFVAVRWSFLMSMFCFLGMITSRVLIEFDLLKEEACNSKTKRDVATLVVLSVGALASQLLSYVNHNLWCWKSLVGMTVHLAKMILNCAIVERQPMQVISVLCTVASMFYVGKLVIKDIRNGPGKKLE